MPISEEILPFERTMLMAESRAVLDAVGLDFLAQGGPAFIADAAGQVLWSNAAWDDFALRLGWGVDEAVGRMIPWQPEVLVALARTAGNPARCDEVIETASGRHRVRSRHWLAVGTGGVASGFAGTIDETAQVERLRRQVGEAQDRLDDIIRLVSDWLWEMGPDLLLTYVSARAGEVMGRHPRELIGRTLTDLGGFVTAEGKAVPGPLDLARPKPFRDHDFIIRHSDGMTRRLKIAALPMFDAETGRFCGFRGTARDVTAETAALDLAARSQSELAHAIESISEGFALYDPAERLVLCNGKYMAMLTGTSEPPAKGTPHAEILRRSIDAEQFAAGDGSDRLMATGLTERARNLDVIEFEMTDGRWIRASDRLTADGHIVGIRTDITELKRRELALIEAKEAAEAASRAKSQFLANISHELRTPLNAIIGFSELILSEAMGPIGNTQYRGYLGDVLHSGRHLLDVINDIIDLAKVEAGRHDLHEEVVHIPEVIEGTIRLMSERAMRGRLTVSSTIAPDLPPLRADVRKLRQIVLNLLSNALKFTPADGAVTVRVYREPSGEMVIAVSDTGIGIAAEDIATAFTPFGQIDGQLSRKFEGTGLGLPLSRAMAELHNGSITIESTVGVGTTVSVRLPAERLIG